MSDAAARSPASQSASQLSENIGDVLASIRRLIAQDEAAEAAAAAVAQQMPSAPLPEAAEGRRRASLSESVSRRRDILAEAQALTRRSEEAFGQLAEASAPLTLGAAERVASGSTALPRREVIPVMDEIAGKATRPLVLTGAVAVVAPAGPPAAPVVPVMEAGAIAIAAPKAATESAAITRTPSPASGAAANQDKAETMNTPETLALATGPSPADPTRASSISALGGGGSQDAAIVTRLQPAAPALPSAELALGAASATQPAAAPAAAGATAFAPASAPLPAVEAAGPAAQHPAPVAPTPTPVIEAPTEEEDCTAMILREMIREVVRQELTGDSAGLRTGDLRSMIMREVAQVLTRGARGTR